MGDKTDESVVNLPQTVRLHSGAALKYSEIDQITRQSYTPIIFLAGDNKSGKTTLLGSIHDAFQFGTIGEYTFAGSETLMAFEERCFEARARSGATNADTPRTRYESGQEYFHLRLRKMDGSEPLQNVLFADMSGEFFERAIQSTSELSGFEILRRSDYLTLLLDGKKLMDYSQWQEARNDGLKFLRRCREASLLRDSTVLQVLISKWDLILDSGTVDPEKILEFVSSKFSDDKLGRQVTVIPVASRPAPGSSIEKLMGVKQLFSDWIETVLLGLEQGSTKTVIPASARVFNSIPLG